MIAPSGGFGAVGSSFGHGMSTLVFQRTRQAVVGLNSMTSSVADRSIDLAQRRDVVEDPETAAVCRGDQVVVLDDEVADRRSRAMFSRSDCQFAPSSNDT